MIEWERVSTWEYDGIQRVWFKPKWVDITLVRVTGKDYEYVEVYKSGELVTKCDSVSEATSFIEEEVDE